MQLPLGFDYSPRTRLVYGNGVLSRLGELARELTSGPALIVTDPGIVAAGHVDHAVDYLEASGFTPTVFSTVHQNPTTADVDACLAVARESGATLFIALGGGSAMDTAKGANFLLTNGGRMHDYWGVGKAKQPLLPLIAIPTTAGTGSECQSFALIADAETHQKMACGDPKAAPRIALLDPVLTVSQPRSVTACTGIDAISHAVETIATRTRNPVSSLYARGAFRFMAHNLEQVLESPDNLEARAAMQLGAAFAGTAIENSMLGAAHAAANPLTAHFDVVHGLAVGLMLPHVIRFNAADPDIRALYHDLVIVAGLGMSDHTPERNVERLAEHVAELLALADLPTCLRDAGVDPAQFPTLAREAAGQWTARHNPREIGAGEFDALYEAAYD